MVAAKLSPRKIRDMIIKDPINQSKPDSQSYQTWIQYSGTLTAFVPIWFRNLIVPSLEICRANLKNWIVMLYFISKHQKRCLPTMPIRDLMRFLLKWNAYLLCYGRLPLPSLRLFGVPFYISQYSHGDRLPT